MTAFCYQISKTACGEFGTTMTVVFFAVMTVLFSSGMTVGVRGIGIDFSIKDGFTLSTLQVVSVAVLRAAGALIHVFHYDSPCHDDGCGVCVDGVQWGSADPSR